MSKQQKKDKLYWVATTGEYGSNKCIHVDLSSWTEHQWELFDCGIAEQDRFTFIERYRKEQKLKDYADPIATIHQAIDYLKWEFDSIDDPNEPARFGIQTAILLLTEWVQAVAKNMPQPTLPYHYDTPEDEVPTFTELKENQ
jgi:hypothetical protein